MKRSRVLITAVVLVIASLFFAPGSSAAQPVSGHAKTQPGMLIVVDAGGPVAGQGETCGGVFDPCGILNNRTDRWLEVARDSTSSWNCQVPPESGAHPRGWVGPGRNSNQNPPGWPDTDCFRSRECSVWYLGILHPPYDWVRIRTSVFIYGLNC